MARNFRFLIPAVATEHASVIGPLMYIAMFTARADARLHPVAIVDAPLVSFMLLKNKQQGV